MARRYPWGPAVDRQHSWATSWATGGPAVSSLLAVLAQGRPPFFPATSLGGRRGRRGSIPGQHPGPPISRYPWGPAVDRQHPWGPAVYPRAGGIIPACPGPVVDRQHPGGPARRYPRATSQGRPVSRYPWGAGSWPSTSLGGRRSIPGPAVSSLLAQGRRWTATSWGAGAAVSQGNIPGPAGKPVSWGAGSWPSTSWAGLSAAVSLGAGGQSCLPFFAQGRPPFFPATSLGGPAVYPRAGSWRGGIPGGRYHPCLPRAGS